MEVWKPVIVNLNHLMIVNLIPKTRVLKNTTPTIFKREAVQNIHHIPATNKTNSAVYDSGATSSCGRIGDNFELTNKKSTKIFHTPNGATAAASNQAKLKIKLREPARSVDIVPGLQHNSLISANKFADANYITVLTPTEVLIYDGQHLTMKINKEAILQGWREESGLWRVPLFNTSLKTKAQYILFS